MGQEAWDCLTSDPCTEFINQSQLGATDNATDLANVFHTPANQTNLYYPPVGVVVLLSVFYGAISLVAVVGNTAVIVIVVTSRRMQSVTNFFIANLALADLIVGMLVIPFQFQAALLQRWNLPDFMCPFLPFFQNLSVNTSIFTLTAIAIDRYNAILFPLKTHASKSRTKIVLYCIWIVSTILAIPMAAAFRTKLSEDESVEMMDSFGEAEAYLYMGEDNSTYQCVPVNMDRTAFTWYCHLLTVWQYALPLALISFAYIRIALELWGSKTPGIAQIQRDAVVLRNKRKVIKMLMVVVVTFALSWLPLRLYDVLSAIIPVINDYRYINVIWFCFYSLAMTNCCCNPFIYLLLNEKFKKELRLKLSKCKCLGLNNNDMDDQFSTATKMSDLNPRFGRGHSEQYEENQAKHVQHQHSLI